MDAAAASAATAGAARRVRPGAHAVAFSMQQNPELLAPHNVLARDAAHGQPHVAEALALTARPAPMDAAAAAGAAHRARAG
eukprot:8595797-Alexandrium_andersonii.AAC.1